jgi:hypothetical protein
MCPHDVQCVRLFPNLLPFILETSAAMPVGMGSLHLSQTTYISSATVPVLMFGSWVLGSGIRLLDFFVLGISFVLR